MCKSSFVPQKDLVSQAVKKDTEGDYKNAVTLYCNALAFFVPAIHCENLQTFYILNKTQ